MIETGDFVIQRWSANQVPNPSVPEPGTFSGQPQFLDRPLLVPVTLYVGGNYTFSSRIKGKRPITVKMVQDNVLPLWSESFQLIRNQLGFTVSLHLKQKHIGTIHLRYLASNSNGEAIFTQTLNVIQGCACR